ncbi:MAG: hypothetical protein PVI57_07665 [Gemmatimonadota bacterium]
MRVGALGPLRAGSLVLLALLHVAAFDPLDAQPSQVQHADSVGLRERAREAQARFERERVRHLPRGWESGGGCDDEVGRMCWRHDTGGSWTPEPEVPEIESARRRLLETLAGVARDIPGDSWVLGQRVWYLGESGRWEEAAHLARRCGTPDLGWCDALAGLALHELGRYEEAEASFDRALQAMGPDRAAAWRDPGDLLDGDGRDALERAREEGREAGFVARLWNFADPLYLVGGNDRRSEHFARHTVSALRSDARTPYGISWGSDLEELLVRYGWEVAWERRSPSPSSISTREGVVGREHPRSRRFVPPGRVLSEPLGAPPEAWVPDLEFAPSGYAPLYAPTFLPASATLSSVPLGDSTLIVATWRLPEDTTYRSRQGADAGLLARRDPSRPVQAGLSLRSLEGESVGEVRTTGGRAGTLVVAAEPGPYVVSVETLDPGRALAGRLRVATTVRPVLADVPALSDLLVLDGPGEPASLSDALGRLSPDLRALPGATLRIAWTVAGLGFRREALAYRLSVGRSDRGFFRRAGEWMGLLDADHPALLEWEEPGPTSPGAAFRSVSMTLPPLDPGSYVLRLELGTRGRNRVVSERAIEVVPQGRGAG